MLRDAGADPGQRLTLFAADLELAGLVRFVALFDPTMRPLLPLLDNARYATNAKAERVLGWKPRSREDAIVATAESLVKCGIVGAAAR